MKENFALFVALLLAFGSPAAAQDVETYDHVVIILDASGSMSGSFSTGTKMRTDHADGTKMDAAQSALKQVLAATPSGTRIGLLVFGESEGWAYPLGPRNDGILTAAINGTRPGGGTPLGAYLKIGADALLEAREAQHGYGTYRLLVVTDGDAGDPKLVSKFTPLLLDRGLILDVIGVKMESDHMLKGVANTYRSADDPESLVQAVREVFAEVSVGGTSDDVGADAFEVLEGLPDSFAVAAIEALSTSPGLNHPLGTKPARPGKAAADGQAPGAAPSPAASPDACSVVGLAAPSATLGWLAALALGFRRRRSA